MSVMMVQFLSDEYELPGEVLTFLKLQSSSRNIMGN